MVGEEAWPSSEVGADAVLLIIIPAWAGGGGRNPAVAEADAKREVGANSEEVK